MQIASAAAVRLRCVSITPFGSPVDPEVYTSAGEASVSDRGSSSRGARTDRSIGCPELTVGVDHVCTRRSLGHHGSSD